ncbi:unnamed protein product [Parajaminaea phylloscopi]
MVSIAVNWTPPASAPLFDDDSAAAAHLSPTGSSHSAAEQQNHSSSPLAPVNTNSGFSVTSDAASATSPAKPSSRDQQSALSPTSPPQAAAAPIRGTSPQPRSYAAAAASASSHSSNPSSSPPHSLQRPPSANANTPAKRPDHQQPQQSGVPQVPAPAAFGGAGSAGSQQRGFTAQGAPAAHPQHPWQHPQHPQHPQHFYHQQPPAGSFHHNPGFGPAYNAAFVPPTPTQYAAWAQYQQMMASQQHPSMPRQFPGAASSDHGGSAGAGSSVPSVQRPAPLTYNDTFHQQPYPGVTYASASRAGLPPGAMAPSSNPSTGPTPPAGNSFHPYRRQGARPADGVAAQGSPTLSSHPSPSLAPPSQRSRASSTDSRKEGSSTGPPQIALTPRQPVPGGPTAVDQRSAPMRQSSSQPGSSSKSSNGVKRAEPLSRTESSRSTSSGNVTPTSGTGPQLSLDLSSVPHSRSASVSSQSSTFSSGVSDKAPTVGRSTPTPGGTSKKSSPLARSSAARNQTHADDDDDDDTNADYGGSDREDAEPAASNGRATPTAGEKKKGLSGKLRKALSLSTVNEMQQADARSNRPSAAPSGRALPGHAGPEGHVAARSISGQSASPHTHTAMAENGFAGAGSSAASISSRRSTRPPVTGSTDGSGKRSLFNRKFNSSTDNISISSTVSSASVMLRKVGNLGKLARRHSLMGLTNMFNRDKDASGKEGMHGDHFGEVPVPADEAALAAAGVKGKKSAKKGKGDPAVASVSHATVELDPNGDGSMTPAAHYVRQHQLQMQQQAEAEARAARLRQEAAEAAAEAAARKGKTTDDVVESRQKMIEKEKERLKSKRGWKSRLKVGSSGSSSASGPLGASGDQHTTPTGLETMPYDGSTDHGSDYSISAPRGVYPGAHGGVPQSAPQLGEQQFGGVVGFDADDLEPPRMPAAGMYATEDSGDEEETDSLRHWGEGIERSRASAARITNPKGILKKSSSYSQLDQHAMPAGFSRPFAGRMRANSYDAPQASSSPAAGTPMLSAMSTTTEGVDRMDGVARLSSDEQRRQDTAASPSQESPAARNAGQSPPVVYGHHSNSSMPTLALMTNPTTGAVPRRSMQKKRICFTEMPLYHSTWPAHVYDRRGELATCNRLTQELAAQIKEELNSYKMEEMEVAPSSRIFTHFFV